MLITGESGTGKELVGRGGPRREPPGRPRVRHRQLRGHPARPGRVGDVRARARRLHRRHRAAAGSVRAGARGHPLPRRDRRPERRGPGQAAPHPGDGRAAAASAPRARSGSTCASSRPPTAGWRTRSPTATSGRTCSSGSNVFPIHLPPLRERLEDLPALVTHLAERVRPRQARDLHARRRSTRWRAYAWPGNVRELANLVERLSILCAARRWTPAPSAVCCAAVPPPPAHGTLTGLPALRGAGRVRARPHQRRADPGGGQRRRGRPGAADRSRQSVPPHAPPRDREGRRRDRVTRPFGAPHGSLAALLLLLALPAAGCGPRTASSSSIPTRRPSDTLELGRPASGGRGRAHRVLQRLDHHAGGRGRHPARPAARSSGRLAVYPRHAPDRRPGGRADRRRQRYAAPAAGRRGSTATSWWSAAGCIRAPVTHHSGRERVYWDAAPVMQNDGRTAGDPGATAAARRPGGGPHQLPDRQGPDHAAARHRRHLQPDRGPSDRLRSHVRAPARPALVAQARPARDPAHGRR